MRYVTYNAAGDLTGCYLQDLLPAHEAAHIEIADGVSWPAYKANAARDGIELLPPLVYDLAAAIAAAIAKTYIDVDAVYDAAIGRRGTEYADAEADARAYVAAGYTGTPTAYVSDFATDNPTGTAQTNAWAADQIIGRADAFRAAQLSMRSTRFARQKDMWASTTAAGLATAVAAWDGYIAALRGQLGL